MTNVQFSETSFAFALTSELMVRYFQAVQAGQITHMSGTVTATFPNLRQERHLGYDVVLPFHATPLCYQFKLSEPHSKKQTKTLTKRSGLTALTAPSYYFQVKKQQNETLIDTAKALNIRAFYCAPKFHLSSDFNNFAASRVIVRNSLFLRPPTWPDALKSHRVVFDLNGLHRLCSEPIELDGVYTFDRIYEELSSERRPIYDVLEELLKRLREILQQEDLWRLVYDSLAAVPEVRRTENILPPRTFAAYRWISWIMSVYFDVRLYLL